MVAHVYTHAHTCVFVGLDGGGEGVYNRDMRASWFAACGVNSNENNINYVEGMPHSHTLKSVCFYLCMLMCVCP